MRYRLVSLAAALLVSACASLEIYPPAHGGIDCNPRKDGTIDSRCKPDPPAQKQDDELPSVPDCRDAAHSANPDQRCVEPLKA